VRRGSSLAVLVAFAVLALVALLDLLTPADVDFHEFYLVPVVLTAWVFGWRTGVLFALLATGIEVVVDSPWLRSVPDWPPALTVAWNALSDFIALTVVAVVTDRVYQERDRWQKVNDERSRLLHLLEQEIPRPLHAIDWFARTFEEAVVREVKLSQTLRQQFEILRHHIQEVNFLANDLVRIGRVRSGELVFTPESVDLKQVAAEAAEETIDRNRLVVQTASDDIVVYADPDALRHAISAVIGRLLETPHETVEVFARRSEGDGVVEITRRGALVKEQEFELANLLMAANGGRLWVVQRAAGLGTRVSLAAPLVAGVRAALTPSSEGAPRT